MKNFLIAATALSFFALTSAGGAEAAPSFNCHYAKKAAEQAVCSHRQLARLDRRLALVYARKLRQVDDKYTLKQEQRGWLHYRNHCGYDAKCLRNVYRDQIRFLNNW